MQTAVECAVAAALAKVQGQAKTAGVRRRDVIRQALKDAVENPMTRDHWRAYSRHAALNLGLVEEGLREGRIRDAVRDGAFVVIPPSHHTRRQMEDMLPHTHGEWYRWGASRGPRPGT